MRGYSLFELLIVLAIIGFAAMMAPAAFNLVRHDFEVTKLADAIQGEFRLARSRAILDNEMVLTPVKVVSRRLRLGAGWYDLPKGISVEISDRNLAIDDDNRVMFYPDGSSSGVEVRIRGKKTTRLVVMGLNGKTTISTVPD
jgi:prepilin-type N-terminal cleavage/methylation domain-containing protein